MFLKKRYSKKQIWALGMLLLLGALFFKNGFTCVAQAEKIFGVSEQKSIFLSDGGLVYETFSKAKSVEEFLKEQKIAISEYDMVHPRLEEKIYSGSRVIIQRAKKIIIKEGGKIEERYTLQKTIEQAIWEDDNIELDQDDITSPMRDSLVKDKMTIVITHVLIKEETKNLGIDFKTVSNEDDKLGWRIKKVTQKGEKGIKEVKYRVVYNDGKEIARKILESNVAKEPVNEIVTQGTYVKLGKAARGAGTWYAFKGGLFAASRTIARGSYAKVTNMDNGQSVIVQINDYGPQGAGRIIDLDKVAFAKLADLGVGVLNSVKVEQVLN